MALTTAYGELSLDKVLGFTEVGTSRLRVWSLGFRGLEFRV